jgi:two-component system response regulator FlrC
MAILVVDDEAELRTAIREALRRKGLEVDTASDGAEAIAMLKASDYGMVISDVKMPGMDGLNLLKEVKRLKPEAPVLLITAFGTIEKAVEAVKEGAIDFLLKPFSLEALEAIVEKTLRQGREAGSFEAKGKTMVAKDPLMRRLLTNALIVAGSDATVLMSGESGTGKELLARFIHAKSPRAERPFVAVNCASLPEGLLESELFGHEKGAFTGAISLRHGKFEQANTGTILLDEISEMDLKLQAKLLRVIQEKEIERLGGKSPIPLDVRIIATTNRDLRKEVRGGHFREDLFYRLNIFPMTLPPLRERGEDKACLSEYFLKKFTAKYLRHAEGFSEEAMDFIMRSEWRGNIREMENTIERAVLLCQGRFIEMCHIIPSTDAYAHATDATEGFEDITQDNANNMTLRAMEKGLICKTLDDCSGNRTKAAQVLGISVRTLRNKLKEYGQMLP